MYYVMMSDDTNLVFKECFLEKISNYTENNFINNIEPGMIHQTKLLPTIVQIKWICLVGYNMRWFSKIPIRHVLFNFKMQSEPFKS